MRFLKAFAAGFVATLVFHQGALALLYFAGIASRAPFSMTPTEPLGVPQVLSLAFWGGIWGIILLLVVAKIAKPAAFWTTALLFGTLATTAVAAFVVVPLKGQPIPSDQQMQALLIGLTVNFAWALGTALMLRLFGAVRTRPGVPEPA